MSKRKKRGDISFEELKQIMRSESTQDEDLIITTNKKCKVKNNVNKDINNFCEWLYAQFQSCEICGHRTLNAMSHMMEKHFQSYINCDDCGLKVLISDLGCHIKLSHPIPLFECNECFAKFSDYKTYAEHIKQRKNGEECLNEIKLEKVIDLSDDDVIIVKEEQTTHDAQRSVIAISQFNKNPKTMLENNFVNIMVKDIVSLNDKFIEDGRIPQMVIIDRKASQDDNISITQDQCALSQLVKTEDFQPENEIPNDMKSVKIQPTIIIERLDKSIPPSRNESETFVPNIGSLMSEECNSNSIMDDVSQRVLFDCEFCSNFSQKITANKFLVDAEEPIVTNCLITSETNLVDMKKSDNSELIDDDADAESNLTDFEKYINLDMNINDASNCEEVVECDTFSVNEGVNNCENDSEFIDDNSDSENSSIITDYDEIQLQNLTNDDHRFTDFVKFCLGSARKHKNFDEVKSILSNLNNNLHLKMKTEKFEVKSGQLIKENENNQLENDELDEYSNVNNEGDLTTESNFNSGTSSMFSAAIQHNNEFDESDENIIEEFNKEENVELFKSRDNENENNQLENDELDEYSNVNNEGNITTESNFNSGTSSLFSAAIQHNEFDESDENIIEEFNKEENVELFKSRDNENENDQLNEMSVEYSNFSNESNLTTESNFKRVADTDLVEKESVLNISGTSATPLIAAQNDNNGFDDSNKNVIENINSSELNNYSKCTENYFGNTGELDKSMVNIDNVSDSCNSNIKETYLRNEDQLSNLNIESTRLSNNEEVNVNLTNAKHVRDLERFVFGFNDKDIIFSEGVNSKEMANSVVRSVLNAVENISTTSVVNPDLINNNNIGNSILTNTQVVNLENKENMIKFGSFGNSFSSGRNGDGKNDTVSDEVGMVPLYECEYCDIEYVSLLQYAAHVESVHGKSLKLAEQSGFKTDVYQDFDDDLDVDIKDVSQDENGIKEKVMKEDEKILKSICQPIRETITTLDDDDSNESDWSEKANSSKILNKDKILIKKLSDDYLLRKSKILGNKRKREEKEQEIKKEKRSILDAKVKEYQDIVDIENSEETLLDRTVSEYLNSFESDTVLDDEELHYLKYENEDVYYFEDEAGPLKIELDEVVSQYLENANSLVVNSYETGLISPMVYNVQTTGSVTIPVSYGCNMCGNYHSDKFSDFIQHIRSDFKKLTRKKPLQRRENCPICNYIVPMAYLLDHVKLHLTHTRCSLCRHMVENEHYNIHLIDHRTSYVCSICNELFVTPAAARKHSCYHRKGTAYKCDECSLEFTAFDKLVCHLSFVHFNIVPEFSECPYCLELTDDVKNHLYSADRCRLKCKMCLEVILNEEKFIAHMGLHFNGDNTRKMYIRKGKETFLCKRCNYLLLNVYSFEGHMKIHKLFDLYSHKVHKRKRVYCDICQVFMPESMYDCHRRNHKFYELCRVCFKYISKSNIEEHKTHHKSDFRCNLCNELFDTERKLDNHRFCHTRKLQRPCGLCALLFSSEEARVRHVSRVHKMLEPTFIECYYCEEMIGENVLSHLFEPSYCRYRCKLCDTRHKCLDDYKKHMEWEHRHDLCKYNT